MRIGIGLGLGGPTTVKELVQNAARAEADGFAAAWMPNLMRSYDALTILALAGRETARIELGTFVVPTYPRHPVALAQAALTAQEATGNRLVLGLGLSHQPVIETALGLDYSRPIPHTREYLTVLNGLLAGEPVSFQGELYQVQTQISISGATKPPVVFAALGPQMLRLAGRLADGTATWMGGLAYLRDTAVPTIRAAAAKAGRPAPRVVSGLPVCVTDDPESARAAADQIYERYGQLASYRATLDRGGARGAGDIAVVGSEAEVEAQVRAFAAAGVTDFNAAIFPAPGGRPERTYALLKHLAASVATAV